MTPPRPAVPGAATASRWRAATLLGSPHRLCFFWAGAQGVASALWWWQALAFDGPGAGASGLHALWFALGAMPLFIAGFVLTAGPRWVAAPPVDATRLRAGVAAFSAGWLLAVGGGVQSHPGARAAGALGLALAGAGLGALAWQALQLPHRATRADTRHLRLVSAALAAMAAALVAAAPALAAGHATVLSAIARAALWWGPVAVFVTASHRMLPFLGDGLWPRLDARWPDWPLWLLLSVPAAQGALALGRLLAPPAGLLAWAQVLHLALVAAASAALIGRWLRAPALRAAMLRLLHLAALAWPLALALLSAAAWPGLAVASVRTLEIAALHVLGIGYLGGTLLTMVTRVSATHQGHAQAIDRWTLGLFGLLCVALALRLMALAGRAAALPWLPAAALAWLAVALAWWARHGRWLGQQPVPRGPRRPPPAGVAGAADSTGAG